MRILALDFGSKRIGVATSDELLLTAQGRETIRRTTPDQDISKIVSLVEGGGVIEVVVGLPVNMNGTHSASTREALDFAVRLEKALNVPVRTWDERLTSALAERALLEADTSRARRRELSDRLAAQLILQSYLDSRKKGQRSQDV